MCKGEKNSDFLFVCIVKRGAVGEKNFDDQDVFLSQISAQAEQGLLENKGISSFFPTVEKQRAQG